MNFSNDGHFLYLKTDSLVIREFYELLQNKTLNYAMNKFHLFKLFS